MAGDTIQLQPIVIETIRVPIVGQTPLVVHAWSEKAKTTMRDKQGGKVVRKKDPKDPQAEYEAAFHRLPDGRPGFPASGFKAATIQGARCFDNVTMASLKAAIFVMGEGPDQLVPIEGEPEMWEAPVRIAMGTTDLRYRPRFWPWSATLTVKFNALLLSQEAVVNLINAGGLGGVGEWRPTSPKSYSGSYGMYEVKR